MPQFGTFDLGQVLSNAERIKSYQRQSRLDDLRELSIRENVANSRQIRDIRGQEIEAGQKQRESAEQRANTERLYNAVQIVKSRPEALPQVAIELAEAGIMNPDSLGQIDELMRSNPEQLNKLIGDLDTSLSIALGVAPEKPQTFTLSKGQEVRDANNNLIAENVDEGALRDISLKAEERIDDKRRQDLQTEEGFRKEFNALTSDFRKVSDAFARVEASAKDPSAAGDLALIFNYMKMLDPGSTVREGEFANAQNSGGVPAMVVAKYNQIISGERLDDTIREDFLDRSASLYNAQYGEARKTADQYRKLAEKAGVDADSVIATLDGRGRTGTAPDGTVITNANGETMVKRNGQWVAQ